MAAAFLHLVKNTRALRLAIFPLLGVVLFAASQAHAQTQEKRMDEILHADRNQTSSFAGKSFTPTAAVGGREATVRAFPFGRSAVLRSGDGSFPTRDFVGKEGFRTREFATKADRASSGDAFAQRDREFATKALTVREAPAAGKSAPFVRDFQPGQKSIVIRGKRQDSIDEIHEQKNLSIDDVREILNKPGGRPGSRPGMSTLPVLRALPVAAPNAR